MGGPDLPEVPAALKSIQPYLKIADEHDTRDPVISYWCRLYALQTGLALSTKSSEATAFLLILMDWLEATKKANSDNHSIINDMEAFGHLEVWTLRIFFYADKNDRAAKFGRNIVQCFYTAGLLYDVITIFGDLSEDAEQRRKYAKWKAAYIHNCLKNGQIPKPGPFHQNNDNSNENISDNSEKEGDEDNENDGASALPTLPSQPSKPMQPSISSLPLKPMQPSIPLLPSKPTQPSMSLLPSLPMPRGNMGPFNFPSVPAEAGENQDNESNEQSVEQHRSNPVPIPTNPRKNNSKASTATAEANAELSPEQTIKVQKYIKWAGSALDYDDVSTAILNLKKALNILTSGEDTA